MPALRRKHQQHRPATAPCRAANPRAGTHRLSRPPRMWQRLRAPAATATGSPSGGARPRRRRLLPIPTSHSSQRAVLSPRAAPSGRRLPPKAREAGRCPAQTSSSSSRPAADAAPAARQPALLRPLHWPRTGPHAVVALRSPPHLMRLQHPRHPEPLGASARRAALSSQRPRPPPGSRPGQQAAGPSGPKHSRFTSKAAQHRQQTSLILAWCRRGSRRTSLPVQPRTGGGASRHPRSRGLLQLLHRLRLASGVVLPTARRMRLQSRPRHSQLLQSPLLRRMQHPLRRSRRLLAGKPLPHCQQELRLGRRQMQQRWQR